jgi:hypothetical protein
MTASALSGLCPAAGRSVGASGGIIRRFYLAWVSSRAAGLAKQAEVSGQAVLDLCHVVGR